MRDCVTGKAIDKFILDEVGDAIAAGSVQSSSDASLVSCDE